MKFTVIVNWYGPSDSSTITNISWQQVINRLTEIESMGWTKLVKSVIVQPTILIDPQAQTQRHLTAEQLKAA